MCDLTNRTYFFELTTSPSTIWAQLGGLDLDEEVPTTAVDQYDETLTGNVTGNFAARQIGF